jgi:hypothetical protein
LANPIRAGKERRLNSVKVIFTGYHSATVPTVAYLAILAKTGAEQHGKYLGKSGFSKFGYVPNPSPEELKVRANSILCAR